eukprot:scaffold7470_cov123-Cylindrotheca_fusiformis.AAC.2
MAQLRRDNPVSAHFLFMMKEKEVVEHVAWTKNIGSDVESEPFCPFGQCDNNRRPYAFIQSMV